MCIIIVSCYVLEDDDDDDDDDDGNEAGMQKHHHFAVTAPRWWWWWEWRKCFCSITCHAEDNNNKGDSHSFTTTQQLVLLRGDCSGDEVQDAHREGCECCDDSS